MTCLVTGASGHIVCVLVRRLLDEGYDVRAFVLPGDRAASLEGLPIRMIHGDILKIEDIEKAAEGVDIIFHLAGIIGIGSGQKKRMHSVNVGGVHNIVEVCKKQNIRMLVYVSSVHALTELPGRQIIRETDSFSARQVHGSYAKSKAEATAYLLGECKNGLNAVVVHPSGVIGPYDYELSNLGQMILDYASRKLHAAINGGYNFVDVRDVADGIALAASRGKSGECYILSGQVVTVPQLMKSLETLTGIRAPKVKIPYFLAYMTGPLAELYYKIRHQKPLFTAYSVYTLATNSNFSNEKAMRELGFKSRPIAQTLADTVHWIVRQYKLKLKGSEAD
ncbi:MAG: NAD-dependent epimerase/dehydratase family protein [Clostridia bacterium]|nr:NAD-dependent epimerase/dehydratase family protein [Clostridia bacterium]